MGLLKIGSGGFGARDLLFPFFRPYMTLVSFILLFFVSALSLVLGALLCYTCLVQTSRGRMPQ